MDDTIECNAGIGYKVVVEALGPVHLSHFTLVDGKETVPLLRLDRSPAQSAKPSVGSHTGTNEMDICAISILLP